MGRREAPLAADHGPIQQLAADLRELRRAAGSPSYRTMAARVHFSATTLSVAANGTKLPSLPVLLGYVAACGGDVDQWRARWEAVGVPELTEAPRVVQFAAPAVVPVVVPEPVGAAHPVVWAVTPWWRRLGVAVLGAAAAAVLLASLTGADPVATPAAPAAPSPPPTATATIPGSDQILVNTTIGADCPAGPGRTRVFTVSGPWSVGTRGGWTGDGCAGEYYFETEPGAEAIGANHVDWSASDLSGVPLECLLSIYIPDSPHAAGRAQYQLRQWVDGQEQTIDRHVIDQSEHHGDWVGTGPYLVTGDRLMLDMHSVGPVHQAVTAGVIHLYCGRPGTI